MRCAICDVRWPLKWGASKSYIFEYLHEFLIYPVLSLWFSYTYNRIKIRSPRNDTSKSYSIKRTPRRETNHMCSVRLAWSELILMKINTKKKMAIWNVPHNSIREVKSTNSDWEEYTDCWTLALHLFICANTTFGNGKNGNNAPLIHAGIYHTSRRNLIFEIQQRHRRAQSLCNNK